MVWPGRCCCSAVWTGYSLLYFSQIVDAVVVNLGPLLLNDFHDVVCEVPLDDDLVFGRHRRPTREFLGKEPLSVLQVDVEGGQATHSGDVFLLGPWNLGYRYSLRDGLLLLLDLTSATPFLFLLLFLLCSGRSLSTTHHLRLGPWLVPLGS